MRMKEVIWILVFLSLNVIAFGLTANVTEFDDGCRECNVTLDTTKYISLLENIGIREANLTLKGLKGGWCLQETANVSTSCGALSSGRYYLKGFDTPWVLYDGLYGSGDLETDLGIAYFYINYTKPGSSELGSKWQIKVGSYSLFFSNITIPLSCWDSDATSLQLRILSSYNSSFGVGNYRYCKNDTAWQLLGKTESGSDRAIWEEAMIWNISYPRSVLIKVNNSIIFNHTGNLTGTNASIDLNKNNYLQNCYASSNTCRIDISSSSWGKIELSELFVRYNKTYVALPTILTPNQILGSVELGESYSRNNINISNSGNLNITNASFVSVSGLGAPNLNDSMSWVCSANHIIPGFSIVCNLTISDIIQSAELDEKLKFRGISNRTGDAVFSEGIDLDITVTSLPTGGGGGGGASPISKWKITVPSNRVITKPYGSYGYQTGVTYIQVYNNQSSDLVFNYVAQGIKCVFEKNSIVVQGSSFGNNKVNCEYPKESDTGKIIVSAGGTSQSIDVYLASNDVGYFFILATGKSKEYGLLVPIILFSSILGVLYYVIIK